MQRCTRHTRRLPVTLAALLLATALVAPRSVGAQAGCGFVMGFKALHDLPPAIVGDCLEEEHVNPANGNPEQRMTGGLLVWRAADNWTAFTDGATTWLNGPYGLQSRPNVGPLFAWEAGAPPAAEAPPRPGAVLLADDFNDPVNGILPVRSGNPTRADRAYLEGEYVVRETDPGLEGSPISTLPGSYADAALAVDAKVVEPAADREVMLACRQQAGTNSHYRLGVRPAASSS